MLFKVDTARALPVSPDLVDEVLPHVRHHIAAAVERCGDWTLHDIVYLLQGAQALLWVLPEFRAAAVSQIIKVPRGRICQIIACGGEANSWPEALIPIEQYAADEGCVALRIQGRPGWSRVFRSYATQWHSLEKPLQAQKDIG